MLQIPEWSPGDECDLSIFAVCMLHSCAANCFVLHFYQLEWVTLPRILNPVRRSSQSMLVDCTDCQIACYSRLTCHHKSSAQIDPYIILIFVFIVCTPSFYKTIALSIRRIGQMLITCYGVGMYLYSFVYPCRLIGVCAPKPQVS